ncbi:MAG: NfeD family protein [Phycisphaerales bacterium]|jgi:membrane-bound serine protease (ClpP class)|nr:NfeD family protein [Phycisphaerales bacterium]
MLLSQTSADPGNTLLWGCVLIGATVLLIAMELVIPSGGILAIAAAATLIGSIAAFFMHSPTTGMVALAVIAVVGPLAAWLGWKWWSGTVMAERLVLQTDEGKPDSQRAALLGRIGVAETDLRPIGTVRIDRDRHDALSDHGMIAAGARITVVKVLDNQLKVRPAPAGSPKEHA